MTDTKALALASRILEQDQAGFKILLDMSRPHEELLMNSLRWNAIFIKKAADTMEIEPADLARKLINEIELADFNAD